MAAQQKEKAGEPVNAKHEQAKGLILAAQILTKNVKNPAGGRLGAVGFMNAVVAAANEMSEEVEARMPKKPLLLANEVAAKAQEGRTPSV